MAFHLKLHPDYSVRPQSRHMRLGELRKTPMTIVNQGPMREVILIAALIIIAAVTFAAII